MGDRLQSILDDPERRARVDEEGMIQSHTGALIFEHQSIRQSFIGIVTPELTSRLSQPGIDDGKPFRLACARPNRSFEKEDL